MCVSLFSLLCFSAASFLMCVCLAFFFKVLFPRCGLTHSFLFQMLIPHSLLLFHSFPISLLQGPIAPQQTHTPALVRTDTQISHSPLFTSDVMVSVFPSVHHLVIVIKEVLCNFSIRPIGKK